MKIEDIHLALVRYRFENLELIVPEQEPFQIDRQYISQVVIEKNYEEYLHPFFQISIGIPNFLYRAMKKKPFENKMKIDLRAGKYYDYEISAGDKTAMITKIYGEFICYFIDTTPDINEELQEKIEKENGTYGQGYMYGDIVKVDLLLYKESMINSAAKVINYVLTSATLEDAITLCCNDGGINEVLMSPAQNNKKYKEFCITPIPIQDQLYRICNEYGMHKNGTIVFFDFKRLYIIDKQKRCTAFTKNEYKTTYIASFQGGLKYTLLSGCYEDSKEKYNLLQIEEGTLNISNNQIDENFILFDSTTGSIVGNVSASKKRNSINKIYIMDQGDNTSIAYQEALKECAKILTVGFSCPDLDYLTPNKNFKFISDDPKTSSYNGDYRLIKYTCIFEKEGEYLSPKVVAEFRG